ncbi:hypothetical protein D3Z60_16805 [Lachnospiraceae bacterium]|jgi:hypothetical protein|nr:hypothetical protein [Lachnospiraceae bacterium]
MQINDKFFYINIRDYLALRSDSKAEDPMLARVLSGFSCPKNPDVSIFFKEECGGIYPKEPVSYIPCVFRGKQGTAWIFYPCIKAFVSQG